MVADALCATHGWDRTRIDIVTVTTSGDRIQDRPLADIGGKALWTKELDRALGEGETDLSVHSMKDVETIRPAALRIAAMLPRADTADRLIGAESLSALPHGARVGTSSPRRAAQVLRARADAVIVPFRGNVATRLRRLHDGEADATLLAAAGLDRLGMADIGVAVAADQMLPAPAQGAVGIEVRSNDAATCALVATINHAQTYACVMAERALLAALGGTCHSPIAAMATMDSGKCDLRAEILSPDGRECVTGRVIASPGDHAPIAALAADLLNRASPALRDLFVGP